MQKTATIPAQWTTKRISVPTQLQAIHRYVVWTTYVSNRIVSEVEAMQRHPAHKSKTRATIVDVASNFKHWVIAKFQVAPPTSQCDTATDPSSRK
jgi:hypothetical protein